MYDVITEKLIADGRPLRRCPTNEKIIYLTFDDGPDAEFTPRVLDVLGERGARATFFLVANKAADQARLVQRIVEGGHRLGNHSLDHSYGVLFSAPASLRRWVEGSEAKLASLSGQSTVGFRPPNGIMTRHLVKTLRGLNRPLILWNRRFFDSLLPWREPVALAMLEKLQAGDIILLHDTQKSFYREIFLRTLRRFLREAGENGWRFEALPTNLPVP
jgi:peptidoglycan/xylan/chitin deacetylase (PgdA/CDA1 family)